MKSRIEYFHSRKALMLTALTLYGLSFFLFQMFFLIPAHFIAVFVLMSLSLMFAVICSVLAYRKKAYLFCPKCGSNNIVKVSLFGIPDSITDECPDCHEKINLYKSIHLD